uniref:NADH-ubiquinone oxidoreductase chain 6 n=1 Tax=Entomovelia sp. YC-2015 TaxID=1661400 RepID=A0A0X8YF22_9HEMI|nr:NADH dehydrogenase subunit 6 [Entomovelia sp. YC-2015]
MKLLFPIIMTLSTTIMFMNHPLSMGFVLIIQTTIVSIMMNTIMKYPWYSYMLILIMLGGMLILFMYMASIASNEIMKFSLKIMVIMFMSFTITMLIMKTEIFLNLSQNMMMNENQQNMSLMKLFNSNSSIMTILMAIYLLITMIYVIFITNSFEGPMRKKN